MIMGNHIVVYVYYITPNFVVKYFCDFHELHRIHKKFLPRRFPYSTLKYRACHSEITK